MTLVLLKWNGQMLVKWLSDHFWRCCSCNHVLVEMEDYGGRESSTRCNFRKHLQIKKTLSSIWQRTRCKCSQHNQKRNALQIKCIWLCCEHLQHVSLFVCEHLYHMLSTWWKCFLDLLVLFLFACVFWSCSALSSLGHRRRRWSHRELHVRCVLVNKTANLLHSYREAHDSYLNKILRLNIYRY